MPEFELVPRQQAMVSSSPGGRSDAIREHSQFIEQLGRDKAGKLTPSDGETVATVRRRLGSAAKASGGVCCILQGEHQPHDLRQEAR